MRRAAVIPEPFLPCGVSPPVQAATGHIMLVQEDRFVLEREDGHKQLFVLSHRVPFDPEDLRALARAAATKSSESQRLRPRMRDSRWR